MYAVFNSSFKVEGQPTIIKRKIPRFLNSQIKIR